MARLILSPEGLTAIGFVLVTIVLVVRHVRRSASAPPRCPACASEVAPGALRCPRCDVPLQAFEIAGAQTADPEAESETAGEEGRLHAVVRADVCVGCAACIPVCPESGALRMEGKLAVVDVDRCTGHAKCVDACPVGGIVMGTGDDVHRVTVPDVGTDFQTNVPGVYLAGELGGRGLIKNAINEGRIAVQAIARSLAGEDRPSASADALDLAIVGSGPAGLSAALSAKREGLRFAVLEQGTLADSIRKYPRHKLLLAEPVGVPLYGELWVADASKETLLSVWEAMIAEEELDIRYGCRVESVRPGDGTLEVAGDGFVVSARRVLLANGRRGTPRRLGVPGEDRERVFYDVAEMAEFRERRVLVVGGGDSALESAIGAAEQPGAEVTLSYRAAEFSRAKERNVRKLEEAEAAGRLRVYRSSQVQSILPDRVVLATCHGDVELPNDDVIVRIGGEPPTRFLEKVGVRSVTKQIPLAEASAGVPG